MKNTGRIKTTISIICIVVIAISLFIWTFNKQKEENRWFAVFVPGVMANSPVYSMLAEGVSQAVLDYNENNNTNYKVEVIEAGTNQAEWGAKLTGLAAMKKFEVIFSSNPSIPDLAASITEIYPEQKFIILDSFYEGNPNIATVRFNQREQSYLAGYAAGLATTSKDSQMEFSNPQKKIALISAQEYPVMNEIILPGFIEGAKAVDNDIEVIFKIVGNWYDANKGAETTEQKENVFGEKFKGDKAHDSNQYVNHYTEAVGLLNSFVLFCTVVEAHNGTRALLNTDKYRHKYSVYLHNDTHCRKRNVCAVSSHCAVVNDGVIHNYLYKANGYLVETVAKTQRHCAESGFERRAERITGYGNTLESRNVEYTNEEGCYLGYDGCPSRTRNAHVESKDENWVKYGVKHRTCHHYYHRISWLSVGVNEV